jgi:hypothetical protein
MTTTETRSQEPLPTNERNLRLRKIVFVVWALGFAPLFAALRSFLHVAPIYRSLIGAGLFWASAAAAMWFLGRERQPRLRAWRVFFVMRAMILLPLILTVVDGIAENGWPSGRFNRGIAKVLLMIITMTVPVFLTSVFALIRTYRLAGMFALVAGLSSLVNGVLLLRASWRFSITSQNLSTVLDIIGFGSKLESYLAIPLGIALIVGGIVTFRSARALPVALSAMPESSSKA